MGPWEVHVQSNYYLSWRRGRALCPVAYCVPTPSFQSSICTVHYYRGCRSFLFVFFTLLCLYLSFRHFNRTHTFTSDFKNKRRYRFWHKVWMNVLLNVFSVELHSSYFWVLHLNAVHLCTFSLPRYNPRVFTLRTFLPMSFIFWLSFTEVFSGS